MQIFRAVILPEEDLGQTDIQTFCFVLRFAKNEFISSDAMSKLRQVEFILYTVLGRYSEEQLTDMHLQTGRSGLVVTRLPAAREDPGSRRTAGKSLCFHENHCDMQLWARAAH